MTFLEMLLISLLFPVVGFIFEAYPRFFNRTFGVDIWTHLLYLKEYRKQKGIPKKIENGFLVKGSYDYPPIFIFIMSKFPLKLIEKYEFVFSPFFDGIHVLLIFFISFLLTNSIFIAVTAQIIYLLTPIIVLENSSATPRSLGYALFSLVFLFLFLFGQSSNIYLILLSVFFGSLIFLSHRFTTQGFLFFSLFFSLINRTPIYILVFLSSFGLAVIFSKGFYLEVLKGHVGNLIFWKKNIKYRFYHQIKGNYKDHRTSDFIFKLYNQFLKFPPFVLSITNPWTLGVFFFYFYSRNTSFVISNFIMLAIFSYFLALLTIWVPKLRFLGEGQRYLELSAFPTALVSSLLLNQLINSHIKFPGLILYLLVGVSAFITIIVIQRKAIIKDTLRSLTPEMIEMFSYLRKLKTKPKLLCIPHQITTSTIFHTGCQVFVNADYKNIEKISDVYPYIRKPIPQVMKDHGLSHILLNLEYASVKELRLKNFKLVKRIGNFVLIESF